MKNLKCPFSKKEVPQVGLGSHIRGLINKGLNLTKEEIRVKFYIFNFGENFEKEKFISLYEDKNYTLPQFYNEFGISYTSIQFLIKYYNCKKRNRSESCKIGAKKTKKTNLEKYGVDQTFKVEEFNKKRKNTYKEKYGVDNPFKIKQFLEIVENSYQEKYGLSLREFRSKKGKQFWKNLTNSEKEKILEKTLLSDKCINSNSSSTSKKEKLIGECLLELGIPFTHQFKLKRKRFDYRLDNTNILIEFNGTVFHGDPEIYKPNDILPVTNKTAKEIWENDKKKLDLAELNGYKVIVIWEREIALKSLKEIIEIVYEKVKNYINQEIK